MDKIKCFNRDGYITYYDSKECVKVNKTIKKDSKQFRAVWVSTVENIDIIPFENVDQGKKYLDSIIKTCVMYNLNAIVFQVRPTCDALYNSKINPFSNVLNKDKKEDVDPGFDVLGYLVEKAKKSGIEVHVWMNPYRVTNKNLEKLGLTKDEYLDLLSPRNFAYKNRDLVIETSEHKLVLDPASAIVRDYLVDTVLEIANNYDIKAFHIDDYFYPYDEINDPLEDEKLMKSFPYLKKQDFRRYNVNEMIRKIHEALKTVNKKIEFGISPFAVYRTNSKYRKDEDGWYRGSDNAPFAFQCYSGLYSDVYLWMKEGWIDYVTPQDYFPLDNVKVTEEGNVVEIVKYADIAKWWNEIAKETKTKLYIGMAIYRVGGEGVWLNEEEFFNQLRYNDTLDHVSGFTLFTYHNLIDKNNDVLVKVQERLKDVWK